MVALPTVGGSNNTWGTELNAWAAVEHNADGTHKAISLQGGATLYSGTGVPSNGTGVDGDWYFRKGGSAALRLYQKVSGAWQAINEGTIAIQDEGGALGSINTINFVGSGVVASVSGSIATVNSSGTSSSTWQPGVGFKAMFGTLTRDSIPNAAKLTVAAKNGSFDMAPAIAALAEAGTSLATQLSGLTNGQTKTILPGIYRESVSISATNATLIASGDVSIRGSDWWQTSVWATAPSPNAANGIISDTSHLVPAFTAETDIGQFLTGTKTVPANPEQVFVDGVMYTRKADNATLAAGEWCLNNSTAGAGQRRVIIYLAGGASGHKIEVTTRQTWIGVAANGLTVDGIDFRHCASYANTSPGFQNSSHADTIMQNCMVSYAHGVGAAWGGSSGGKCLNTVFANCGTIGIDTNAETGFVAQGCVFINNGGTNRRYSGALDGDGYVFAWGSGGIKIVGDKGTIADCFAWNNGFSCYWFDVFCRWGSVSKNVAWDNRGYYVHYEVSSYYKIHGNRLFQTNSSQFYADTDMIGIYISTSRDGDTGPTVFGEEANVIMRLPIGFQARWEGTRVDGSWPSSWTTSGQKSVRNRFHHNVVIARLGTPTDKLMMWTDNTSGSEIVAASNGNLAYGNAFGANTQTESGTGTNTTFSDYVFYADKTTLTGQEVSPAGYWISVANLNGSQFGQGPNPLTTANEPSRNLTLPEIVDYLNRYGLPMGN